MDFLESIYCNNTIKSYLIVGGTILFVLFFKRFFSRYIAAFFYRIIRRVWKDIKKSSFIDLVMEPIEWSLVIIIAVFSIDKLSFPDVLDYTIYGHSTLDISRRIGAGVIIVALTWLALRLMDFAALILEEKANQTVDTRDNQLVVFFRDFLKVIIGICGVLLIVKACFNQPIGNLLTGLSIVGAAVALAAKESMENLIASFIIFFDKPFFTGDLVKVNNVTGLVERIGLRSTRIRTGDKTLVTVPNKQMVDSTVDNWSMRTERRAEIKLELSAKTSTEALEQLITGIKQLLESYQAPLDSSSVVLKEMSKNGLLVSVEYFTTHISLDEFDALKQTILFSIKKMVEQASLEFAVTSVEIITPVV
jgi:MscS family membrane protein